MPNLEASPEDLLLIIGRQQVIIEKQSIALDRLSTMYNQKMTEIEELRKSLGGESGRLEQASFN